MYSPGRRLVSIYLLVQGLAGLAWWLILWLIPESRERFQPSGMVSDFILAFAIPDAVLFIGGALVGAWLFAINHRGARAVLWLTAGASAYAALLCLGFALRGPGFEAATAMMVAAAASIGVLAVTVRSDEPLLPRVPFAVADVDSRWPVGIRTIVQIAVFWSVFLVALPAGIAWTERELGFPRAPSNGWVGVGLFFMGGGLGLWASRSMVRDGGGTPLPIDSAPRLVVRGPYSFVRNPMAVGGLLQGLGVAVFLGSWLTAVYVFLGGLIWNVCIRPAEEEDLCARFGQSYDDYKRRVRCWIPGRREH
jgi:protein-S-isoprenylcysteine O-methyltransferase Ste14